MYGDHNGSSDTIARDMNTLLHSSTFKHGSDGEFATTKELISSDSYSNYNHHQHTHNHLLDPSHNYNQNQNQNQNQNHGVGHTGSSLTRYRSAPSSFFANLVDESDFLAPVDTVDIEPDERFSHKQHQQQQLHFRSDSYEFLQYATSSTPMKQEPKDAGTEKRDRSPPTSTGIFCGGSPQDGTHLTPNNNNNNGIYDHHDYNNLESATSTIRSMNSTSSNLIRQSSSPAGFLSSLNAENDFAGMTDGEKSILSSRLNNHINFSSVPSSSSSMFLPQVPENRNEMNDSTDRSLKRTRDGDSITLEKQNGISGHYTPSLIHHMSLPKTSSEMATAEKFLRFEQDSITCKIRAKRGCATHPRSIAERVRRTRISDRMKKLQELFPDMDKQTSIADMLDLAVQYIKSLKKDLQTLNDAKAKCRCSSKQ